MTLQNPMAMGEWPGKPGSAPPYFICHSDWHWPLPLGQKQVTECMLYHRQFPHAVDIVVLMEH